MGINEETRSGGIEEPDGNGDDGHVHATPDPERGGCLNLGWGCLPVVTAGLLILPSVFL